MRPCVLVLLAACGRLGFGTAGTGDGAVGADGPGDGSTDGSQPCTPECLAAGGSCFEQTCQLNPGAGQPVVCTTDPGCKALCEQPGECTDGFECPVGGDCELGCETSDTCRDSTIVCRGTSCDVFCNAPFTCENLDIQCLAGDCTFHCCASNTCNMNNITGGGNFSFAGACP